MLGVLFALALLFTFALLFLLPLVLLVALLAVLLGFPGLILLMGLFLEGFHLPPVLVVRGSRGHAVFELGPIHRQNRPIEGFSGHITQRAVNRLPFLLKGAERLVEGLLLTGLLLDVQSLGGGFPGPTLETGGSGAEVLGGFGRNTARGVAAVVELGKVAGLFQGLVGAFGPVRPFPLDDVLQVMALAVDRVEFDGLFSQCAFGRDRAGGEQDVGVPVAVMAA